MNSFDTKDVTLEKKACIDDLKPVTKYRFFVRAYTTNGAGPPSETVTVKTKESGKVIALCISKFSDYKSIVVAPIFMKLMC